MFRASQIASEETLPALFDTSTQLTSTTNEADDAGTYLRKYNRRFSLKYGLTTTLPPIKYKYPLAVIFVLLTKFFEAFAANGIRTILVLYLRDDLCFSENFSTIMLHIFNFFGQFCPIFGAILADSYFGNVRTISYFCILYGSGWVMLILTVLPNIGISLVLLVSVSLLFIAIGNGSIRACITSLGAQQFKVPEQATRLAEYFSLYYFVYYFGILLSKIVPPYVRAKTQCFNKTDCYPAVFGTLGSSFVASWLIFTIGKFYYKPEKLSEENILLKLYGCIKHALVVKWSKIGRDERPAYWLHNAVGQYDEAFVNDVGKVLKITKLFLPLPVYFALLAQQDSSWTFQASMMNMTVADTITIQPDQAKAMGPILLFFLIPLWQYICLPIIRCLCGNEIKPLQSVTIGGVCSAVSFICAGVLQEYIVNHPYGYVNIVWQVPQFLLLMLGELLLSIPGLKFAFTQAPASMKSVVTAAWFINNAFGNLIVVIITKLNIFTSQSNEYLFYAVLMVFCIIIFAMLAYDYALQQQPSDLHPNHNLSLPTAKDDEPNTSAASAGTRRTSV
ncbi:peptide transporter family 1 [Anastrepha ludens]|uniref:peptide transporter family 1 n=1 Tax=Anastrepha ludens TaxID=28586 RepID=UPI0023B1AB2F|nr:peptide transporter family 1 [Anastrepha ludens]XP_053969521.1 peptide transporter family 1 [Anastrepha ludens]XP_053969522.1 peptide transporter family 1 [Anastrepha ludens]XP_053969523.1 peptide transporter family 1 [Anastrepha ludens]